jgi:hypothetical protein
LCGCAAPGQCVPGDTCVPRSEHLNKPICEDGCLQLLHDEWRAVQDLTGDFNYVACQRVTPDGVDDLHSKFLGE